MIFDLLGDIRLAAAHLPHDHARLRTLRAIYEVLDTARNELRGFPYLVFQTLWNSCAWDHGGGSVPELQTNADSLPTEAVETSPATLVRRWKRHKESVTPGFVWLRSVAGPIRPPSGRILSSTSLPIVEAVALSADSRLAAFGGEGRVEVIPIARPAGSWVGNCSRSPIVVIALDEQGSRTAVGHQDGSVSLLTVGSFDPAIAIGASADPRSSRDLPEAEAINRLCFLNNDQILAVNFRRRLEVWDVSGFTPRSAASHVRPNLEIVSICGCAGGTGLLVCWKGLPFTADDGFQSRHAKPIPRYSELEYVLEFFSMEEPEAPRWQTH